MKVRIFTDGACSNNPGPGGWAAVFNFTSHCKTFQGHELSTTNNRMELMAVVKSLENILKKQTKANVEYELYSDSAYVVNAINNRWVDVWRKNGWKTTNRDDVKNKDLWSWFLLLEEAINSSGISLRLIKIKGHAGNTFNEMVDKLAKDEAVKAKNKIKAGGHM